MFNEMSSEEQLAAARALLTAERAPMNTANLNRAMAALSQGQAQLPAMSAADRPTPTARRRAPPEFNGNNPQNAATQPTVVTAAPLAAASAAQPIATAPVVAAAPPVAPVVGDTQAAAASVPVAATPVEAAPMSGMDSTLEAMMGNGPRTSVDNFMGAEPAPLVASNVETPTPPVPERGDVVADRVASERRIGSANGATRIDENAPERGMFAGAPERLATDVEDPTGLGLTLLAMGVGGVGAAARYGIPAAETIGAQASRLVAGDRAVRAAEATQAAQQAASRNLAEAARTGTRGTVQPTPPPTKPRISVRADSRPSAQPAAPAAPPSVPRDNTLIPSSGRPDIIPAPPLVPPVPAAPVMQVAPSPQLMLNAPPQQLLLTGPGPQAMLSGPPRLPMITNQSLPSAAEVAAMSGRNMQGGRNLVPGPRANLAPGPRRGAQGTTPESPPTMNVPASVREAMRRRIFESIR